MGGQLRFRFTYRYTYIFIYRYMVASGERGEGALIEGSGGAERRRRILLAFRSHSAQRSAPCFLYGQRTVAAKIVGYVAHVYGFRWGWGVSWFGLR